MTNKEAINLMGQFRMYISGGGVIDRHLDEAVQMAIEALKAQLTEKDTTSDCISRQEAIRIASGYCHPSNVAKELAKLPSVQPYTDEEIQKVHDMEQAEIEKAFELCKQIAKAEIIHLRNDPEVEWEEIVRCRQCKYAEVADAQDNQDGYTCQFHRGSIWFSGSYCSWGERKIDEH